MESFKANRQFALPSPFFFSIGVDFFRPVDKSVSASFGGFIAAVEEIFGAVALGDNLIQFVAFSLLYAALGAGHVRVDDGVVVQHFHHPFRHKASLQLSLAQLRRKLFLRHIASPLCGLGW
jgi:hypothetical protein